MLDTTRYTTPQNTLSKEELTPLQSEATDITSSNAIVEATTTYTIVSLADTTTTLTSTEFTTTEIPSTSSTTTEQPTFYCKCPTLCDKVSSLMNSNGDLLNPEYYGEWRKRDGVTYLFGNEALSWDGAWSKCCSLGMKPLSLETMQKLSTVEGFFNNWALNIKFWTSGAFTECNGTKASSLVWCSINNFNFDTNIWHSSGTKDNSMGICVSATFEQGQFRARREMCSKFFAFACESGIGDPVQLLQNGCSAPQACIKNTSIFSGNELTQEPSLVRGSFIATCGKFYYFSRLKKSWSGARNYCCSLGMDLASISLSSRRDCVAKIHTEYSTRLNESYWISGRRTNIPGKHYWCSENSYLYPGEVDWASGFPKNEHECVLSAFNPSSGKVEFRTANCEEEMLFMCMAYAFDGIPKVQVYVECARSLRLATDEEDALLAYFGPPPSLKLMCYARCMGQRYKKILDNSLNLPNMFRYIEDAFNETDLQAAYKILMTCSRQSPTLSSCEYPYYALKCVMINGYQLVQRVLNAAISNPDTIPPMLFCQPDYHFCDIIQQNCTANVTLITQLTSTRKTDIGELVTLPNSITYFIAKRLPPSFTYYDALYYCCSIGKHLLELDSVKKLTDLFLLDSSLQTQSSTVVGPLAENGNGDLSSWCSSGSPVPTALFPGGTVPKNPCYKSSSCLFLDLQTTTLSYSHCNTSLQSFFICE
ncbi:uncharacterized protein LOC135936037 [Cloeon dipterum]|uniref:uncharacterized protein LOC135936037 n=1 Tax=Cloeon dipterum TaxID=197152 RepID=UPI00321FB4AF